jgi:hypothetical protein
MLRLTSPTSVAENSIIPEAIDVLSGYPNPFNASSTISYRLAEPAEIDLSIYNLTGQKISTLVEGRFGAGIQTAVWDAFDIPSGVYFARLSTASESKTLKLSLLK